MATRDHENNFNLLRLLAASMVIFAHAYDLRPDLGQQDFLAATLGFGLGGLGVAIFFTLSGYLIFSSLRRGTPAGKFAKSRMLRLFPGLIACSLILGIGLYPFSSQDFRDYITNPHLWRFMAGNASLFWNVKGIPGVFSTNPFPDAIDGSLWTLPYEALCYAAVAATFFAGAFRPALARYTFTLGFMLYGLYWASTRVLGHPGGYWHRLDLLADVSFSFALGMLAAAINLKSVRLWQLVLIIGLAIAAHDTALADAFQRIAIAGVTFFIAFAPSNFLARLRNLPDYSYGLYIYAFPVQQGLIATHPNLAPIQHACVALAIVLIPASLSWHLIEKPALALKNRSLFPSFRSPGTSPTP